MKCPQCQTQHKYRDGMRCSCGYGFCFNPKRDKLTDGKFLALVNNASGNDTYYFTENQLYTAYCRKSYMNPMFGVLTGMVFVGAAVGLWFAWRDATQIMIVALVISTASFLLAAAAKFSKPPNRGKFQGLLGKYQDAKGPLEKLLTEPNLHDPPPKWPEPDIYDYGVERILVVQRDLLVDLFVRNNLHSAERALIISGKGYPSYLVEQAVRALEENPQVTVFFLHDATPEGIAWAATMSQSERLPWHDHTRLDLGLFPADVRRINRLRPLKPEKLEFALPVDAVPYVMLLSGLTGAMEQQTPLSNLLAARADSDATVVSSFG